MKTKTMLTAMTLVIAMTFFACKGDTGATGPAGANGNANVNLSTITIPTTDWTADGNGGWTTNFTSKVNPTQAAISIYWSTDDVNFSALPFVGYTLGAPDINYTLNSTNITIYYDAQTGVSSISQPSATIYFNVVIIPTTSLAKMKLEHINLNDYSQVNAYIKLNSK